MRTSSPVRLALSLLLLLGGLSACGGESQVEPCVGDDCEPCVGDDCEPCVGEDCEPCVGDACVADACEGVDCSGHGVCETADGAAVCTCEAAWAGEACDACAPGYHANGPDACVPDVACAEDTCSGHGVCDDASGVPVCTCETGYAGEACESCASGFQDHDGDGACAPDCATAGLDCGHGTCEDASGSAACACESGWAGESCDACAAGHHANGPDACVPDVTCGEGTCSGHGTCDDASGVPVCTCETGYAGEACESCAGGFQDHDGVCAADCATAGLDCGHGTCEDASGSAACICESGWAGETCDACAAGYHADGPDACVADVACGEGACSGHGACDDASGVPVCTCEAGYAGEVCGVCASGFQDADGDGACAPDCATAALDCGAHGACDAASGTAACTCDPGYEGAACEGCASGYVASGSACIPAGDGATCAGPLTLDLRGGPVTGSNVGAGNDTEGSCQKNDGEEVVYAFTITESLNVAIESSGFDTILYLRDACDDPVAQLACDDDGGTSTGSRIEVQLPPGTYYLFVDAYGTNGGTYTLDIEVSCGDGYVLDPSTGSCVADPCVPNPCTDPAQAVCQPLPPTGHACTCSPGYVVDPAAPGACIPDASPSGEACASAAFLTPGTGQVTGTTTDAVDDGRGSCAGNGPDRVYSVSLTERMWVQLDLGGYDTALHIQSTCGDGATEVACDDDGGPGTASQVTTILDPGTYYLWADSYSTGGAYTLDYVFRPDPCAGDPCPGTPECVADADWTGYACVCPAGTLPHGTGCVDDPCEPNPCTTVAHQTQCAPVLPGNHTCSCDPGYLDDGQGGCAQDPNANEWTVIVFLNADNNLESFGYDDLAEMGVAGSNPYVNIVVLFDSYARDNGETRTLYVTPGGYDVLLNHGELDLGSWQTLRDFGVWAIQNYPARHYALFMWDHGEGWRLAPTRAGQTSPLKAFSNDDHGTAAGISIANGDYARALQDIMTAAGAKLDLVGFDACLMGMYEVAHATAPYAHYFVGSSETEPAIGWDWDTFLPSLTGYPQLTADQLGIAIVDAYFNASPDDSTLAVSDLGTMAALDAAVTAFANELMAAQAIYTEVENARQQSESFDYGTNRDLMDFAQRVAAIPTAPQTLKNAANALVTQLQTTIVHSRAQSGYPGSNGLAVYLPGRSDSVETAYTDLGATWSRATTWDEFLQHYTTH